MKSRLVEGVEDMNTLELQKNQKHFIWIHIYPHLVTFFYECGSAYDDSEIHSKFNTWYEALLSGQIQADIISCRQSELIYTKPL